MEKKLTLEKAITFWREEKEAIVWDIALPKIAGTKFEGIASLITEGGKYYLTLRENFDNPQNGVITVEVNPPYKDQLEGVYITLIDGTGTEVLKGRIVYGKVSQRVTNIKDIDLNKLFVKPMKE